ALAGTGETVRVWDAKSGELSCSLKGHTDWIRGVAWHPTEAGTLATASDDATVKVWSIPSLPVDQEWLFFPCKSSFKLAFSADDSMIATGSEIWEMPTGRPVLRLRGQGAHAMAFGSNGEVAIAIRKHPRAGRVIVWDIATRKKILSLKGDTSQVS